MNPEAGGKTELLPFDEFHVPVVDIAAGKLVIVPSQQDDQTE
jgi:hypothetical protein